MVRNGATAFRVFCTHRMIISRKNHTCIPAMILLLLIICCLSWSNSQAAELTFELDKTQIEMGKYIAAKIVYLGNSEADLTDLQQWEEDFFVDRREQNTEKQDDGQIKTIERIRLYPRSSGIKVLDAIALGGAFVRPIEINVEPLIRDGINGSPKWLQFPSTLWQGQTIDIGIEVPLLHASNHVGVEDTSFAGFEAIELLPEPSGSKTGKTVIRRWRLTARRVGEVLIDPPFVEQRGRGRWRFHLPRIQMMIRPLPAYLPSTLPVGVVSVNSTLEYDKNIPIWVATLSKVGAFPEEVFGVRAQLARFAGVSVENVALINSVLADRYEQSYRVPVPEWSIGFGSAPVLSVEFFDTKKGRVSKHNEILPMAWNIPSWANYIALEFLFALFAAVLFFTYKSMKGWWQYRRSIKKTTSAHELRRVLLEPYNLHSLDEWECGKGNHRGSELVEQINAMCFSRNSTVDFTRTKKLALSFHFIPMCIRSLNKI